MIGMAFLGSTFIFPKTTAASPNTIMLTTIMIPADSSIAFHFFIKETSQLWYRTYYEP